MGEFFSLKKNKKTILFMNMMMGEEKNNIRVISSNKYLQDQNSVDVINSTESKIYIQRNQ